MCDEGIELNIDTSFVEPTAFNRGSLYQFIGEVYVSENIILRARIATCIDGMDMNLFNQALDIRRKYLQEDIATVSWEYYKLYNQFSASRQLQIPIVSLAWKSWLIKEVLLPNIVLINTFGKSGFNVFKLFLVYKLTKNVLDKKKIELSIFCPL